MLRLVTVCGAAVRIDVGPSAAGRPIAVRADPRQHGQIWWLRGHEHTVWVLMSSAELAGRIWLPAVASDEARMNAGYRRSEPYTTTVTSPLPGAAIRTAM